MIAMMVSSQRNITLFPISEEIILLLLIKIFIIFNVVQLLLENGVEVNVNGSVSRSVMYLKRVFAYTNLQ